MLKQLYPLATMILLAQAGMLYGADTVRQFIIDADPVAPVSAAYETNNSNVSTSKMGVGIDFNVAARVSMGPELWTGNFIAKEGSSDQSYRKEDLWPGERQKVSAMRLRWMVGFWEQPQSMRGWYTKVGYSYQKVNSQANRYDEIVHDGTVVNVSNPDAETDLISDTRHGVVVGFGNRWLLTDQRLAITAGASFTHNIKRSVNVDSKDAMAERDYEDFINNLPDTKLSLRPVPELNIGLGYAW